MGLCPIVRGRRPQDGVAVTANRVPAFIAPM